jgi:vacuolar-type H+-ATPase subunit F/Vma7
MSLFVMAEPVVREAFALVGIPGRTPGADEDLAAAVTDLARREGVRLLLLQSRYAARLTEADHEQLASRFGCVIAEIPGLGEAAPDAAAFRRQVRSAIGVVS